MKVADSKKIVVDLLKPYAKRHGYKYITDYTNVFFINRNENVAKNFGFYFSSDFAAHVFNMQVSIDLIEDPILDIISPGLISGDIYLKKDKNFMPTCIDTESRLSTWKEKEYYCSNTEEKTVKFASAIIEYLETKGFAFAERYSIIPNIFEDLDNMHNQGRKWEELLGGVGVSNLFKGLLISKLANDPNYMEKVEYCSELLHSKPYFKEDLPYFERVKELIKTINPIYNL